MIASVQPKSVRRVRLMHYGFRVMNVECYNKLGLELFRFGWLFAAKYPLGSKRSAIGRTTIFWPEHFVPNPARAARGHYHQACYSNQNFSTCQHKSKFLVTTYLKLIILSEKC